MTLTHTEKAPQEEAMPTFLSNDALSSQSSLMDGTANKGAEICALHTNNLTVGYEGVPLISDIEIKLHKGEMLTLIGPNGAGKSTLMNMLGCLDTPTSGKYVLDGQDVASMTDNQLADVRNKEIGFIFQGFNLISNLDAVGNVELPLVYRGVSKNERKQLAMEALKSVGLEDRMKHKPNEMSGGQQQRVAVARAVAAKPPIILADEPTGNLDTKSTQEILEILKELHRSGRTVIIITHDEEIASQAHRVIRILDGRIEEDYCNR